MGFPMQSPGSPGKRAGEEGAEEAPDILLFAFIIALRAEASDQLILLYQVPSHSSSFSEPGDLENDKLTALKSGSDIHDLVR